MGLTNLLKKHEKDFKNWWQNGEDFTPKLEEALVEYYLEIPYTILTGETGTVSEWLNDKLSTEVSELHRLIKYKGIN